MDGCWNLTCRASGASALPTRCRARIRLTHLSASIYRRGSRLTKTQTRTSSFMHPWRMNKRGGNHSARCHKIRRSAVQVNRQPGTVPLQPDLSSTPTRPPDPSAGSRSPPFALYLTNHHAPRISRQLPAHSVASTAFRGSRPHPCALRLDDRCTNTAALPTGPLSTAWATRA